VPPTRAEFWAEAIAAVRKNSPDFLFLGEVYWNLETQIKELGFDYTYDKRVLDMLLYHRQELPGYLASTGEAFLNHGAHFLENHDEPRIAARMTVQEQCAAALLTVCLPGMRFLHEGQLTGAKLFTPVHFGRRPLEPVQTEIADFYQKLLRALPLTAVGTGKFHLLQPRAAWPENPTAQNLVLLQWRSDGASFDLVAINLAPHSSQCRVVLELPTGAAKDWELKNLLGEEEYIRQTTDMAGEGLFLDLPANGAQLLHCSPRK